MKLDSKTKDILEWIICIIIAFILALIIRYYVGTPTIVKQTFNVSNISSKSKTYIK